MPDLGTKHECLECGAKFYDLGKPDPACPRCGASRKDLVVDEQPPARDAVEEPEADEPEIEAAEIEEEDEVLEDLEEEDEEILDDDLLDED